MIQITSLKKTFGENTAVDIESAVIPSGQLIGLVGNNGAGKTTLFRLMLDLLSANNGFVTMDDINPAQSEDWKQFTAAFIDEGFLIDFLSPEEYFEFILTANGIKLENSLDEALAPYQAFMADEILGKGKLIRDYSAGNKQKIGIIAALLSQPKILILDEPFNFLDPSSQNMLKQLLKAYHDENKATILVSSHNLQHTIDISERILLMEHGKLIQDLDNTDKKAEQELENYFNT